MTNFLTTMTFCFFLDVNPDDSALFNQFKLAMVNAIKQSADLVEMALYENRVVFLLRTSSKISMPETSIAFKRSLSDINWLNGYQGYDSEEHLAPLPLTTWRDLALASLEG